MGISLVCSVPAYTGYPPVRPCRVHGAIHLHTPTSRPCAHTVHTVLVHASLLVICTIRRYNVSPMCPFLDTKGATVHTCYMAYIQALYTYRVCILLVCSGSRGSTTSSCTPTVGVQRIHHEYSPPAPPDIPRWTLK